ncbi:MAG: formylmethanofuran dehydrogenase subunit B [Thermodesulfobacteriota bacterium]
MICANVSCPFCGCLCDDLEITVENGTITGVKNACAVSRSKFLSYDKGRAKPMLRRGEELTEIALEEAVNKTVEILGNADFPLIYGLSSMECDAQRLAIELAELVGGNVDNSTSVCHGPTILAAQDIGAVKCTLGEVKNRGDLIIFWGCNPAEAHIRHLVRYSASGGLFIRGRRDRTIICVDVRETPSTKAADVFVKVEPGRDYELISALRATLKGYEVSGGGLSANAISELAERMKNCKFGVIFFGLGLTMTGGKHMNVDAALRLVRDLNDYTKFSLIPMRGHYNVTGADEVSLWQTGYPYAINFSRGYPLYNPGEFSAVDILAKRECDAALIIASDPIANFPAEASKHLVNIPTIAMDPKVTLTSLIAKVVIPTAFAGIECEGTAYRMDGVPIRLKKIVEPEHPSDKEILEKIIKRLKS